jgi:hypothetical protein
MVWYLVRNRDNFTLLYFTFNSRTSSLFQFLCYFLFIRHFDYRTLWIFVFLSERQPSFTDILTPSPLFSRLTLKHRWIYSCFVLQNLHPQYIFHITECEFTTRLTINSALRKNISIKMTSQAFNRTLNKLCDCPFKYKQFTSICMDCA